MPWAGPARDGDLGSPGPPGTLGRMLRRLLVLLALATGGLCLRAQHVQQDAETCGPQLPTAWLDRVLVKVHDALELRVEDGRPVFLRGAAADALAAVGGRWERLVTAAPVDVLDAWHAHACATLAERDRPGRLANWFRVRCMDQREAERICSELLARPEVTHAYREPIPHGSAAAVPLPGDVPPVTPSYASLQRHLGAAPTGHGITPVHGVLGARGRGVRLVMVEEDWILDHEDVSQVRPAQFLGNVPPGNLGTGNHGIAGSSLLAADRDQFGVSGIVDEADLRFVSLTVNGGTANSLVLAALNCPPGGVVMMVLQFLLAQVANDDWVPVEYFQSEYDAVRTVTSLGAIVVASAANGRRSLDDPRHLRRFDRGYRDSGAIFVGATVDGPLVRASYSNYGSRVDVNGWGENIVAAGYGTMFLPNNDWRQSYTAGFAGTSASTPIVTGVVTALQGAARQQLGRSLTSTEVLQLLRAHGPSTPDAIGRRADLEAMLRALGAVDGLLPSAPDVVPGGSVRLDVTANGIGAVLCFAFGTGSTALGFNRPLHLDTATLDTLGFVPLVGGSASTQVAVPALPALSGVDLFLQAVVVETGSTLRLTNSVQVTVL